MTASGRAEQREANLLPPRCNVSWGSRFAAAALISRAAASWMCSYLRFREGPGPDNRMPLLLSFDSE